jgi:ankyrin repeat protein
VNDDTNDRQDSELRPLLRAIAAGDGARVSTLLDASPPLATASTPVGASREASSEHFLVEIAHYIYAGDTPLHIAAAAYQTDIAKELITRGGNVRARNRMGAEPLHYASDGQPGSARWNPAAQAATVDSLIRAGADANAADNRGVTPLHRAVRTRCAAAAGALLAHGADPRLRNRNGSTPLQLAVRTTGRGGSGSVAAKHQQAEIIRMLEEYGARPSSHGHG